MNRIDRYISGMFWINFIGGLLIFVTIFLAIDAMSTMVNYKGVGLEVFGRYYAYTAPEIIYRMLPVACLLGGVLTISSLNKNSELIALFACGMSLKRIATPLLGWVLLICVLGFVAADRVLPSMNRLKNYIYYNELEKKPTMFSIVKTDKIWYRSKNAIFNLKTLAKDGHKAEGLTLYFFDETWSLLQMLTASKVDLDGDRWSLEDGSVTLFSKSSSFPLASTFKTKTIQMSEDVKDIQSSGQTSDLLSQDELKKFINKNREAGLDTLRYEMDYQAKFGFALAGLVMTLLGIPFSVSRSRGGGVMINIGICIGLVFVYWIFYSSFLTLGTHGTVPPLIAAWAPNAIMGGGAWYLLSRLRR